MRSLFTGYYPNSTAEIDLAIPETLVAFDANVLLNLYRYPTSASGDILRLMEALGDKVWLPYHVGLEYQRNRLIVIADQKKRFREVRAVVEKGVTSLETELGKLQLVKRHSTIDISQLISDLTSAQQRFINFLNEKESAQRDVMDPDLNRERLDQIFLGKIGKVPDKDWISAVEKEGKVRYEAKCPPGYCDQTKEGEIYTHEGCLYRREFGDLILWKQMLTYAKEKSIKQLIFVTDDEKEDWWLIAESAGPKRIGPRPELIEEAKHIGAVEKFCMLNSEWFAPLFAKHLKIQLGVGTIEQVKDVKSTLSETVTVLCPSCDSEARIQLGKSLGSSAMHFCSNCKTRFHIHRDPDGGVFTREWGGARDSSPGTHRVVAECPKCLESVPANIRYGDLSTDRYCMSCCSLLKIDSTGNVLSNQPSSPLTGAKVISEGNYTLISCPQCLEVPPLKPFWRDGLLVRTFCPSCQRVIEGQQSSTVNNVIS